MIKCRQYLAPFIVLGCLCLTGCPDGKQSGEVNPPKILTRSERAVFEKINDYRRKHGLNQLTIAASIVKQARNHSRNMARNRVGFSHEGFNGRVRKTGINYLAAAENIAYNHGQTNPVTTAVTGWINSAGHRRNIEGDFNQTGIGVIQSQNSTWYFTQIFIKTHVSKRRKGYLNFQGLFR
jgi:uncharacterized protein YkwD